MTPWAVPAAGLLEASDLSSYPKFQLGMKLAAVLKLTRPEIEIVFPSVYNETVKVAARWEDAEYSLNPVRSAFQPTFGLVMYSKRLDALAQTTIVEALRPDLLEAPQRETERREKVESEIRLREERARARNKGSFRP